MFKINNNLSTQTNDNPSNNAQQTTNEQLNSFNQPTSNPKKIIWTYVFSILAIILAIIDLFGIPYLGLLALIITSICMRTISKLPRNKVTLAISILCSVADIIVLIGIILYFF